MHIAIDTTPLTSGHAGRGIGAYTRYLLDALGQLRTEHTIHTFTTLGQIPKGVDVVHYPYFDPFFLTLPRSAPAPFVVTIHDLIPIVFPKHFPRGVRGEVRWQMQRYRVRKAARVITDSESSKRDVVRFVGVTQERVTTIHLAANPALKKSLSPLSKFPKKYFLYVGDVNWNKNIEGLLHAFADIHTKATSVHFVFVGDAFLRQGLGEAAAIDGQIKALELERFVHKVGKLTDEELSSAYSHAIACVQPSWYEGFGLPILEAFTCGCPVVCALGSSLDEIAGPAIRVNPADTKSIADGMMRLMSLAPVERNGLVEQGTAWVKNFTWQKVAKQTIATYEDALRHHTGL